MSSVVARISAHVPHRKSGYQKDFKSGAKPKSSPVIDVREFDINSATSLISKCPGGHVPKYAGISKGQSNAHFPLEACMNCELGDRCPSKQQAKNFVVRISLKAIESGREQAPMQAPGIAAASQRTGIKGKAVSVFREHGVATAAAVLFLLMGIAAFPGVAHQVSDDLPPSEPVGEIESPEIKADVLFPDQENIYQTIASESESIPDIRDAESSERDESAGPADKMVLSASAQAENGTAETGLSEDSDTPESLSDDSARADDAVNDPVDNGASGSAAPTAAAPKAASGAPNVPQQQPSAAPSPEAKPLPYLIYVSKNSYTIAILGLDEDGEYSELLRTYNTAIGRTSAQTRAGTYKITTRERWRDWGGVYTPYSTKHSGGLFFHGPVYYAKDPFQMKASSYNEIGSSATSGCMRTSTAAAAWIYYNCPDGTQVIIANDSKYTSVPQANIDDSQNYDPTDPDVKKEIPQISLVLNFSEVELMVGESIAIEVSSIIPEDAKISSIVYSSGDSSVATVDPDGIITAVSPGTAVITVTAVGPSEASQACQVSVALPDVSPLPPNDANDE